MNRHSVLFKINITFVLSFIILSLFFVTAHTILKRMEIFRFKRTAFIYFHSLNKDYIRHLGRISRVKSQKKIRDIIKNGHPFFNKKKFRRNMKALSLSRNVSKPSKFKKIYFIKYDGGMYAYYGSGKAVHMIKNTENGLAEKILLLAWVGLNIILLFLYLSIYRSIRPLRGLRQKMEAFSKGDMDIDLKEYKKRKDEIGFIAEEFANAVANIKQNLNTRIWLIRNIAHELKTPITKGRIAVELLKDESKDKKEIFESLFLRLESLINQLLAAEKITLTEIKPKISRCELSDLLKEARSILFADEKQVKFESDRDYAIKADCEMFTIALKNLIDNGIKFGLDNKVAVKAFNGIITFISKGDMPRVSPDLIFEPFIKDASRQNGDGFGLGLYITKKILEKHGLTAVYRHENGNNIFSIDINDIEVKNEKS